jgi:hypothetical protein
MTELIPRVLWLDDELNSDRASYVLVWRRWLQIANDKGLCRLTTCNCLEQLSALLAPTDLEFDLLIFDVMLKREPLGHFGPLGFADERLLRMDAGAQIVGLLRNKQFDLDRPTWLKHYANKPVVLFSSTPSLKNLLGQYVDSNRRDGLHCLVKSLNTETPGQTRPDDLFVKRFEEILKHLAVVR